MATPVGHIEVEFLFKVMFEQKLPIMYVKDRTEYSLTLEYPASDELVFRPDRPLGKLPHNAKLHLLFDYRKQVIDFNVEVIGHNDGLIYCKMPKKFYKNLDRNYLRVDTPSDLKITFTFESDQFNLEFPKVSGYENITSEDLVQSLDYRNLPVLIKQITGSLKNYADGFKIVNFKDKKPETLEEKIVSETGKTLFIPSTAVFIPKIDPYPKKRLITEALFKRYLEATGVSTAFLDENCELFLKRKLDEGIYSDAWVPLLFHEYVIGYIHIWIDTEGKPPFPYNVLDNVYDYAKVLAFSLKENGYFEHGKVKNEPFQGKVLDISASGLLFACPLGSTLLTTLLVDSTLSIKIETPKRVINFTSKIVRCFKDRTAGYFGCRFINMLPEDKRFLFEYLYGRQIDDRDAAFLSGQV